MQVTDQKIAGRTLISEQLFDRLEARITADHPELPDGMPARILDQALAFLAACAVTTQPIGPSELVDIGWHTFILYTREYADFCDRIAGRFIHHNPDDNEPGTEWPTIPKVTNVPLARTVEAMKAAGYRLDGSLWNMSAADCSQCHAGCTDSPTGG